MKKDDRVVLLSYVEFHPNFIGGWAGILKLGRSHKEGATTGQPQGPNTLYQWCAGCLGYTVGCYLKT